MTDDKFFVFSKSLKDFSQISNSLDSLDENKTRIWGKQYGPDTRQNYLKLVSFKIIKISHIDNCYYDSKWNDL